MRSRTFLFIMLFLVSIIPLHAMEKGVFKPPSQEGFIYEKEFNVDVDEDGIGETHVTKYVNAEKVIIYKYTTEGKTWAWGRSKPRSEDRSDITKNFAIMDSNCDDDFDERYRVDEEFYLPDCMSDKVNQ